LLRAYASFRAAESEAAGALLPGASRKPLLSASINYRAHEGAAWVTEALLGLPSRRANPRQLALDPAPSLRQTQVLGRFSLTRSAARSRCPPGSRAAAPEAARGDGGHLPRRGRDRRPLPEADLDTGRSRLRRNSAGLASEAGDVVHARRRHLSLASDLRVDLHEFEREARRTLALGSAEPSLAVAVAASAISRYRGNLLPEDPYEPWLDGPRERAGASPSNYSDLCSDVATERVTSTSPAVRRLASTSLIR